jgi:hypothetical protein
MNRPFEGFPDGFEDAAALVDAKQCALAVFRDGEVVKTAKGSGVTPLLDLFDASPETLRGAAVADKVIGKAAAMILVQAGAAAVYGSVMSEAGREYLTARGIPVACRALALRILNRQGDGLCPIEQSVADEEDPAAGVGRIRERLVELKTNR